MRKLLRALEAIHVGFWLGLLDRAVFDTATRQMYQRMETYRQDDYNLSGFTYWEQALVDRYLAGPQRILVAGAGGGREVVALARQGAVADGFDPDPGCVECGNRLLRQEGLPGRLLLARPSEVPEAMPDYDAAIVGWGAYTHIAGRQTRIQFLHQLADRLPPGGHLLLSFFTRGSDAKSLRLSFLVARAVALLSLRRTTPELGDTFNEGFFHRFTRDEIESELQQSGFRLLHYDEHPYGHAVAAKAA